MKGLKQKRLSRHFGLVVLLCAHFASLLFAEGYGANAEFETEFDQKSESPWVPSITAKLEGGYRSNIGLSPFRPDKSPYALFGFEGLWFRLPVDGFESTFFITGSDREYFHSEITDREQEILASASARYALTQKVAVGITGTYLFQDQVFDASVNELEIGAVKAQVHLFSAKPFFELQWMPGISIELGPVVTRANFIAPLDDYWEEGAYAALKFQLSPRTKLIASMESALRPYDTRDQATAAGDEMPGVPLEFQRHEAGLSFIGEWGKSVRLKSTTAVSGQRNIDNGSGFYDYVRTRVAQHLKCSNSAAAVDLSIKLSHYNYGTQVASATDSSSRGRLEFRISAMPELKVTKTLKWYALLEWDRSWSNLASDTFSASTIATGFELDFF